MQHYHSLLARMPDVRVELLVSNLKESDKAATKRRVSEGTVEVLVGTSAVLAAGVTFANLGLIVVDEEQLFGVRQKEGLKSVSADLLLLSATPIPRTSALPVRLKCHHWHFNPAGGSKPCGWEAAITAANKSSLLRLPLADSWEGDLAMYDHIA